MANNCIGRISYIFVVKVTGPTNPIHSKMPRAAPRAAVFALRQMQICANTKAISKFNTNVMMYGQGELWALAFSIEIFSRDIHCLLNKVRSHNAPRSQNPKAKKTTRDK